MTNTPLMLQNRDLKLRSILAFAHASWDLHRVPTTWWLLPVAQMFRGRCAKLRMLMMLPSGIGQTSMKMQRALDQAHIEILGAFDKENITEDERIKIGSRTNELLIAQAEVACTRFG